MMSTGSGTSSSSRSTSARVHGIVPGVNSMAAPAAIQRRIYLLNGHPRLRPTAIAATIASPAPTPLPDGTCTGR